MALSVVQDRLAASVCLVTSSAIASRLSGLVASLEHGELEKVVLTQRNQMRAVLITLKRYNELEQRAA